MTSQSGIIFKTLIDAAGFAENDFAYTTAIFITTLLIPLFVISGFLFFTKSGKSFNKMITIEKPTAFDSKQKQLCILFFS